MQSDALTPKAYIDGLPAERQKVVRKIRSILRKSLPKGFKETMSYGMLGYVVPLSLYPDGYHCRADTPLPFISVASQKQYVALYHMGIYASPKLLSWFKKEYTKRTVHKFDMGKSCIRFKKLDDIPYDLIEELAGKITVREWIDLYESSINR